MFKSGDKELQLLVSRFLPYVVGFMLGVTSAVVFQKPDTSKEALILLEGKITKYQIQIEKFEKEIKYNADASKLTDYCYKSGHATRHSVVKTVLRAIDMYLPKYFKEGPFTREDFMALALTETSNFNQYTVGTSGEKGIFQVMPDMCKARGVRMNHFDIYVNTELSMFVMNEKFKRHKDYRDSIIAYNGFIKDKHGRVIDKYWKRFIKYRQEVGIIFNAE